MSEKDERVVMDRRKKILRNHLRVLLQEVENEDGWANCNNLTSQVKSIITETKKVFPINELDGLIPPFDEEIVYISSHSSSAKAEGCIRVVQLRTVLKVLLDYYYSVMGDQVAQSIIDDYLGEASEALKDPEQKHPELVASVFIRISIEQALKTLCNLNTVAYNHSDMSGTLNSKLTKAGVYPGYKAEDMKSKLNFLNAVVHGNATPPVKEVAEALDWANRFISSYLPGPVGTIDDEIVES